MVEAVWVKANLPDLHKVTMRTGDGVKVQCFSLADIDPSELPRVLFYGEPLLRPDEFRGFSRYYNTLDPDETHCAANVLDARGSSECVASAWLVGWDEKSIFMAHDPERLDPLRCGLVIRDWRYVVRICNIDPLVCPDLPKLFAQAMLRVPTLKVEKPVFYVGGDVAMTLRDKGIEGVFRAIPITVIDELRSDEARL